MAMEWTATPNSSQITRIGFDSDTNTGGVGFINRRTGEEQSVYVYDSCTREEADAIINAESVGRQFAATWKFGKVYRRQ